MQWLCFATQKGHDPERRVRKFFTALRAVLAGGARAVLQLYPEQPEHMQMLRDTALDLGFTGGLVCDYPWSERSKKLFLVLVAPTRSKPQPVEGGGGGGGGKAHGKMKLAVNKSGSGVRLVGGSRPSGVQKKRKHKQ